MERYEHVLRTVTRQPWAILPETLSVIAEVVQTRLRGERFTEEEIRARIGAAPQGSAPTARTMGGVSILPLYGVIAYRMNMLLAVSGGTSTALLAQRFREAVADPTTNTIVLDVDSPGGMVDGVPELADEIFAARGQKRIVAVANTLMASGAYWIASQADEVVASPSALVGSIGVYLLHIEQSKALETEGIKPTLVSAGKFKVEANPYEPLSEEAQAFMQATVDATYEQFVKAVARGRNVTPAAVRSGYGEGRKVWAKEALKIGLVDRIATLDETIARLSGRRAASGRAAESGDDRLESGEDGARQASDAVAREQEQLDLALRLHDVA